jgi:hypothetical protein
MHTEYILVFRGNSLKTLRQNIFRFQENREEVIKYLRSPGLGCGTVIEKKYITFELNHNRDKSVVCVRKFGPGDECSYTRINKGLLAVLVDINRVMSETGSRIEEMTLALVHHTPKPQASGCV